MSYTIQCRNCGKTVAKTPNQVCVNCRTPKWGYSDYELNAINSGTSVPPAPVRPAITKLVCKHCNTMVAKTPNNRCIKCGTINWGYTDYELANGMIKTVPDPKKKIPVLSKTNIIKISSGVAAVLLLALGIRYVPDWINPKPPGPGPDNNAIAGATIPIDSLAMSVAYVQNSQAVGTAFLISPTKLLTAAHMVINFQEGTIYNEVTVTFTRAGNKRYTAKVLKAGSVWNQKGRSFFLQDFALLEIPPGTGLPYLRLGNSDDVKELDDVMTIGHSKGDLALSFTDGKINSTRYGDDGGGTLDLFKHSIASNHGNSGGPIILKKNSTVIGILVGGRGTSVQDNQLDIPQGENIANKINNVKRELNQEFNLNQ